jgi:hypothetical protein
VSRGCITLHKLPDIPANVLAEMLLKHLSSRWVVRKAVGLNGACCLAWNDPQDALQDPLSCYPCLYVGGSRRAVKARL